MSIVILDGAKKRVEPNRDGRQVGGIRRINRCVSGISPQCPVYFEDDRTVPLCDYCGRVIEKQMAAFDRGAPNGNLPPGMTRLTKACVNPRGKRVKPVAVTGDLNLRPPTVGRRRVIV